MSRPQMQSIAWSGSTLDGSQAELLQLSRCEGMLPKFSTTTQQVFMQTKERERRAQRGIQILRDRLDRTKEEVELFQDRLRRVKKMLRKADPDGYADKHNSGAQALEGVDSHFGLGSIGFADGLGGIRSPRKERFLLEGQDSDDESDEEEVDEVVREWVGGKVDQVLLYGFEIGGGEGEKMEKKDAEGEKGKKSAWVEEGAADGEADGCESDDEEYLALLDKAIANGRSLIQSEEGYDAEQYEKELKLKRLKREKFALFKLICDRTITFKAIKTQLGNAERQMSREKMEMHYYCRMNQLHASLSNGGRSDIDLTGGAGPLVFDQKPGKEEDSLMTEA